MKGIYLRVCLHAQINTEDSFPSVVTRELIMEPCCSKCVVTSSWTSVFTRLFLTGAALLNNDLHPAAMRWKRFTDELV